METQDSIIENEDERVNKKIEGINYINKSFLEITDKGISLNNLTFDYCRDLGKKFFSISQIFKKRKNQNKIIHSFLRLSYLYDNTNIDTINELANIIDKSSKNNFSEKTREIVLSNEPIIKKDKFYYKEKLFELMDILSEYDINDIMSKYKIEQYIMKCNKLNKIVKNFNNDISLENIRLYLFSLYYNWLFKLYKFLENNNKESLKAKDVNYIDENFEEKAESRIILEKNIQEKRLKIAEILNIKTKVDNLEQETFENIVYDAKNKEIIQEYKKNLPKIIPLLELNKNPKFIKIEELLSDLREKVQILKRLDVYFNSFYQTYLIKVESFLKGITKTRNYLKNLDYTNKLNLKLLTNFVFFLSYYDFSKIIPYKDYFEKAFEESDFKNNEYFKIKDGTLIVKNLRLKIENYNDYNLNIFNNNFEDMEKTRFLREKYIKFNYFPQKNLFNKYIDIYKEFFKDLFLKDNSCIKNLFIKTFPVLKSNYFINERLLEYLFNNKIFVFNFKNSAFVGLTEHSNLNISIKDNFSGNKDISSNEICVFASFIVILIHELAHFTRIYIHKHLKVPEYDDSFDFEKDEIPEIGRFIEKKLFGRVIEKMNVLEAIYIINIDNYSKSDEEEFLKGFIDLKNKKTINIEDSAKKFLKRVNIINFNFELSEVNNEFTVKGNSNCLNIGINNDKCANLKEIERVQKSIMEQYKDEK